MLAGAVSAQESPDGGIVTQGLATETFSCGNLATACTGSARRFIEARCGIVVAPDGTRLQVPVVPADGPDPTDLYNSCTGSGHNPAHLDDLETVVIDADGEEVTGYLSATTTTSSTSTEPSSPGIPWALCPSTRGSSVSGPGSR